MGLANFTRWLKTFNQAMIYKVIAIDRIVRLTDGDAYGSQRLGSELIELHLNVMEVLYWSHASLRVASYS